LILAWLGRQDHSFRSILLRSDRSGRRAWRCVHLEVFDLGL